MPEGEAAIVPELLVDDLETSLSFYVDTCGFRVRYARLDERFVYFEREGAQLMFQEPVGRTFLVGSLGHPYGRGMNLQIAAGDVAALSAKVQESGARVHLGVEERWYRLGGDEAGVRQFVVEDPDGYLLRFAQDLGTRRLEADTR